MLGRAAGVSADVRCTRPGAAGGMCWCASASIDPQALCAHMERCLRRVCVTWERAIPTDEPPASAATLRMRPSRLQMVVLPICSEYTAPDDSNTIAPPARWPHSSVLSSSLASRGVSATRRGLRSLPPPCSTSANLQSAKHAARACSTLPRARRQVCRPRSVLLGWHAPRQRAATRGISSSSSSPLQHLQESNTRRLRSHHLIAASGSFACGYGGD